MTNYSNKIQADQYSKYTQIAHCSRSTLIAQNKTCPHGEIFGNQPSIKTPIVLTAFPLIFEVKDLLLLASGPFLHYGTRKSSPAVPLLVVPGERRLRINVILKDTQKKNVRRQNQLLHNAISLDICMMSIASVF